MVVHSSRGKKTASDSEETHPSTRYIVWCSDSRKTHPMCSLFRAVYRKHNLVRGLLFASKNHLKSSSYNPTLENDEIKSYFFMDTVAHDVEYSTSTGYNGGISPSS
jgi:hypothetical protein